MATHKSSVQRDLMIGAGAGLLGMLAVGPVNAFLSRFISEEQYRKEHAVRDASPHDLAAEKIAERFGGNPPSEQAQLLSQLAFGAAYGLAWGMIYAMLRRSAPPISRFAGLPFGSAFFFLCDGVLAPLFRMSPPITRLPWQPNTKEMLNHVAWTAAAELAHRAADRKLRTNDREDAWS